MDDFDRPPGRPPDKYEFLPAALNAGLTAAIVLFLVVAWQRFLAVAPRLGVGPDGQRLFTVAVVLLELVLLWQIWRQGRKALRLYRDGRR